MSTLSLTAIVAQPGLQVVYLLSVLECYHVTIKGVEPGTRLMLQVEHFFISAISNLDNL